MKLFNMQSAVTIFDMKFLQHKHSADIDLICVHFAPLHTVVQRVRQISRASALNRRR
jgi:hypothetical protein